MASLPVRGLLLVSALLSLGSASPSSPSPTLTFEQRIEAQRAIERVYYSHQTGATESFDAAVPTALLEQKVRAYLRQSEALERFWNVPVTARMLRDEMNRMARGTRMPDRLRELYAALGNDPILVQECLVRPALVERLSRGRFTQDLAALPPGERSARTGYTWRTHAVASETRNAGLAVVAADEPLPEPAASTREPWNPSLSGSSCPTDDVWDNASLDDPPDPAERSGHTAVWTGSVMLAWGGFGASAPVNTGLRYDPATDTATPISTAGAPSPRYGHAAAWTGSLMLIWGGRGDTADLGDGARYNPVTDTWSPMTTTNAPTAREFHTAVWTGTLMIVWGGYDGNTAVGTGARYNPTNDKWTSMSTTLAPSGRYSALSVWTGSLMVVWAGTDGTGAMNTGGRYNPSTNSWSSMSTSGAPVNPDGWPAVWSGSLMLTWGNGGGARYDPATNAWTPMTLVNQPSDTRNLHQAAWTGSAMFVWGGYPFSGAGTPYPTDGGLYNPVTDTWSATSNANVPMGRNGHSIIWTGSSAIVWGGRDDYGLIRSHARYNPATDTWSLTDPPGPPGVRDGHTAVWTGNQMIIWGGAGNPTGSRYNPALDTWTPTSTVNQPIDRNRHTAIWTGSRMIVWGGGTGPSSQALNTGGAYDPIADAWTTTSLLNAPSARLSHMAVWTGSEMIVWGGGSATGGRYSPATDTWTPVSTTSAPASRAGQTAVWTGSRMVIWGDVWIGGRYDPSADQWTAISTTGAPDMRYAFHTAIWAGSRMLVFGGFYDQTFYDSHSVPLYIIRFYQTGKRYDPSADSWSAMAANAAGSRQGQSVIWTGLVAAVWGGQVCSYTSLSYPPPCVDRQDGARYDPATDTWTAMSVTGAPSARSLHTAVWTGDRMMVWGGRAVVSGSPFQFTKLGDGGMYGINPDSDGDGFTVCAGDCNDANPAVHPGAAEICDGVDDNCDGLIPAGELDADGDGLRTCQGDCDDGNASVWGTPGEVAQLDMLDGVTLQWSQPQSLGGTGVVYDLIRSSIPGDFVMGAACVESDGGPGTTATDAETPPPGGSFCYLVRAQNSCPGGQGSLGFASDGTARVGRACP